MNYIKLMMAAVLIMCFVSAVSYAQDKGMMKKDSIKTTMMKDGMKKEMMGKDMMKKDNMKKNMMSGDMKGKEMMHEGMMMKIDKDMDGVAIKGYDPVGYFTDSKAEMGDKMYSYNWMGAEWHFMNEKHMNMFKENPEKYAPQYGGYCAYGVSGNHLSSTDPNAWTIVDGKLYLNTNSDVKKMFSKDEKGNIMKAKKNWPGLNKDSMK